MNAYNKVARESNYDVCVVRTTTKRTLLDEKALKMLRIKFNKEAEKMMAEQDLNLENKGNINTQKQTDNWRSYNKTNYNQQLNSWRPIASTSNSNNFNFNHSDLRPNNNNNYPQQQWQPIICYVCKKPGHKSFQCKQRPGNNNNNNDNGKGKKN